MFAAVFSITNQRLVVSVVDAIAQSALSAARENALDVASVSALIVHWNS